jgi:hypothetical protein
MIDWLAVDPANGVQTQVLACDGASPLCIKLTVHCGIMDSFIHP